MSDQEYVKERIRLYVELALAVEELVEHAEPMWPGDGGREEYAVDGENYDRVFNALTAIKTKGARYVDQRDG